MARRSFVPALIVLLVAGSGMPGGRLAGMATVDVPASCPVTAPRQQVHVPPPPYPASAPHGGVWIGSDGLWVMTSPDGTWRGIRRDTPDGPLYRNKQFWWRSGYHGPSETAPALHVTGRRVGSHASAVQVGPATNAFHHDFGGWAMLVMLEVPAGCWELTGQYGDERVTLVVWSGE